MAVYSEARAKANTVNNETYMEEKFCGFRGF